MRQPNICIGLTEVKVMTTKSMLLCPRDIITYYHDEIRNEERAKRIVQAEKARKSGKVRLAVEEVAKGEYILIERFEYYSALLKTQPDVRVPCFVYPGTSDVERLIHILKISIPLKGTSWLFKNEHVMKLIQNHGLLERDIAKKTYYKTAIIKYYILDTRIPQNIRERALQMKAKTVLEEIARSTVIPEEVKMILYSNAIIEQGNDFRLTGKKLDYMKEFCSVCFFPDTLLKNTSDLDLERLINYLISKNFEIKEHMTSLLDSFLSHDETSYRSTQEEYVEIIH
ncbi:hypothetical protein ACFOGI_10670 [Virgibacillus xinjiangensis]|uniref:Uncharacterized protein n=1 Tax=Virgibacillus xinjiangensis TaxID=393090 RepID=A0ABV7CWG8_9BACI